MKVVDRHRYKGKEIVETRRITFRPFVYTESQVQIVMGLIEKKSITRSFERKKEFDVS